MTKQKIWSLVKTILVIMGLSLRIEIGGLQDIFNYFEYDLVMVILTPILYVFISNNHVREKEMCVSRLDHCCVLIPAFLFSIFMVVGYSFEKSNSLYLILGSLSQMSMAVIVFIGYFVLLRECIIYVYFYISNNISENIKFEGKYKNIWEKMWFIWEKRPILTTVILFVLIYLPYIIASYPAIFWGDTPSQIAQGFNLSEETSEYLNLISENVKLNSHHPVVHTLLIHLMLVIGGVLGSYNIGIFFYSMLQFLAVILIMSCAIYCLYKQGIAKHWLLTLFMFYALSPRLQNNMFLVTKDIIYGVFTLMFIMVLQRIMRENSKKQYYLLWFLSQLGMIFFRNEGIYVVVITGLCVLGYARKKKQQILFVLSSCIMIFLIVQKIIFPYCSITPGSKREMLSIPFQQTARYIKTYSEEITDYERNVIDAILDFDAIGENYQIEISNPVKSTFNENATSQEMAEYFKVWFQMFLKHPIVYFEATLNQLYQFFYPDTIGMARVPYQDSSWLMKHANKICAEEGEMNFHHPEALNMYRTLYEKIGEIFCRIPVTSLLASACFYFWTTILGFFYFLKVKNGGGIVLLVPLILQFLVCFAGPLGGTCYRYVYPITISLFPAIGLGLLNNTNKNTA